MPARTVDDPPIATFELLVESEEAHHGIVLTPDEKALALSVARAHYFCHSLLEELPARARLWTLPALSWSFGLMQVCKRREGRVWP